MTAGEMQVERPREHKVGGLGSSGEHCKEKGTAIGLMNLDNRIAARYVFESRILIRFCRGSQKFAAQGWARP
jgi:hypothetical protein